MSRLIFFRDWKRNTRVKNMTRQYKDLNINKQDMYAAKRMDERLAKRSARTVRKRM